MKRQMSDTKLLCFKESMSLIRSSGVYTKLNICLSLFCIGGLFSFFGNLVISIVGCVFLVLSFFIGKFGVICPNCGCNWLFTFLTRTTWNLDIKELYNLESCPRCNLKHNKQINQDK